MKYDVLFYSLNVKRRAFFFFALFTGNLAPIAGSGKLISIANFKLSRNHFWLYDVKKTVAIYFCWRYKFELVFKFVANTTSNSLLFSTCTVIDEYDFQFKFIQTPLFRIVLCLRRLIVAHGYKFNYLIHPEFVSTTVTRNIWHKKIFSEIIKTIIIDLVNNIFNILALVS